ncbi:hypothetical protein D3C73_603660 [compost metagenome]
MYEYPPTYFYYTHRQESAPTWTASMVALNQQLRALWSQHVYWTRLTVNSIIDRLPDEQETTARLLRNATDFAAVLEPVYGSEVASSFAKLLTEHLTTAAELIKAMQARNSAAAMEAQKRWYANADAIADFLSQINPYWSREEWRNMMYEHLNLLTKEINTRFAGDYKENVALSDSIEQQALGMADVMTNGIVQQFPAMFTQ